MASLSLENIKPFDSISNKAIPEPLRRALKIVFKKIPEGVWLMGGTALSGFYAEHRKSNDMDLFASDPFYFKNAIRATQSLQKQGAVFQNERSSAYYYHADIEFKNYQFTADVVLDENLARIGKATSTADGIWVADLPTLFKMKASTLVSRCSEKDLYDLNWMFERIGSIVIKDIIAAGQEIDVGLNIESLLVSLNGATLREEACHFLFENKPEKIKRAYKMITELKDNLISKLLGFESELALKNDAQAIKTTLNDYKKLQ